MSMTHGQNSHHLSIDVIRTWQGVFCSEEVFSAGHMINFGRALNSDDDM